MSRIRSKNTKPELLLRRLLHARGFRFRVHQAGLPGHPDLVLPKFRAAVFVHGCFWHGHSCADRRKPKTNVSYWNAKIGRNVRRDEANARRLRRAGWGAFVVWSCHLFAAQDRVVSRLAKRLEARS